MPRNAADDIMRKQSSLRPPQKARAEHGDHHERHTEHGGHSKARNAGEYEHSDEQGDRRDEVLAAGEQNVQRYRRLGLEEDEAGGSGDDDACPHERRP